jgi:hypothetical protein
MPFKGNDFQHTRSEAYAALTYDKYGHEHDEAVGALVDVENGVRKYWADQLGSSRSRTTYQGSRWPSAVNLLDPYSGDDGGNNEFARTALDDRPEGAKHITPNDED